MKNNSRISVKKKVIIKMTNIKEKIEQLKEIKKKFQKIMSLKKKSTENNRSKIILI